jgi:hypothetical protein
MTRLLTFLSLILTSSVAYAASAQDLLLVGGGKNSATGTNTNITLKDNILPTIQVYLLATYSAVAIGMLIYMGFKLYAAQGDEGEFKKAWIALVYVIVGLAIAPLAYIVVRIVTWLAF